MIWPYFWGDVTRTERPDFDFDQRSGAREVMESLGVMNLEGFGIQVDNPGLGPAGAVLVYAEDVLKGKPGNLRTPRGMEGWESFTFGSSHSAESGGV